MYKMRKYYLNHGDLYFLVFLNLFLVLKMVTERDVFFRSTSVLVSLVIIIATLLTILIERFLYKFGTFEAKRDISIAIIIEIALLLSLTSLPVTGSQIFLTIQFSSILLSQFLAIFFLSKVFKTELIKLFMYPVIFVVLFYRIVSREISFIKSKILIRTVKPMQNNVSHVLTVRKLKIS